MKYAVLLLLVLASRPALSETGPASLSSHAAFYRLLPDSLRALHHCEWERQ